MNRSRAYQIAIIGEIDGQRSCDVAFTQIPEGTVYGLSQTPDDLDIIADTIRANFPHALEYLAMRVPPKQFKELERERRRLEFGQRALRAFMAYADLQRKF